jgi:TusA-related sulfurtransferase
MPAGQVETLDIRGQVCPASLLMTLKRLNGIRDAVHKGTAGLDVLTDNRDSVGTISESVLDMGYQVDVAKREGHYLLSIRAGR